MEKPLNKKKYYFPEREIVEYECMKSGCEVQFRTDYKEGDIICPFCHDYDFVIDIRKYNTNRSYRENADYLAGLLPAKRK